MALPRCRQHYTGRYWFLLCFLLLSNLVPHCECRADTRQSAESLDIRVFQEINLQPGHRDALDPTFLALMPLGTAKAGGISLGLYTTGKLCDDAHMRRAGVLCAAALAVNALLTEALKGTVGRRRPVEKLGDDRVRIIGERMADGRSFPSGHTSTAFAWARILSHFYPKSALLFYGTAGSVGIGRVRLGAHYPSDVAAGALTGFLAGQLVLDHQDLLLRGNPVGPGLNTSGAARVMDCRR